MYRRMQALFPRTMRQCYHHVSEIKKILRNHSLRDSHYAIFFSDTSSFICNTCSSSSWSCFICHNGITDPSEPDTEIIKCDFNNCGRHYHRIGSIVAEILAEKKKKVLNQKIRKCLSLHKFTTKIGQKSFKCPHHTCHTCASKSLTKKISSCEANQSKVRFHKIRSYDL